MTAPLRTAGMLLLLALPTLGCRPSPPLAAKAEPPAKVSHPTDETALNTITLSEKAYERLGIATVELKLDPERRRKRTIGGEVLVPPGRTALVAAPIAGTLAAPMGKSVPLPGSEVAAGDPVFDFLPLLSPERDVLAPADRIKVAQTKADIAIAQIEAQRQLAAAQEQLKAAKIVHERAVELFEGKAGAKRTVDEAYAQLRIAEEALTAATTRTKFLAGVELDTVAGELQRRTITAPVAGVVQRLEAAPGETVAAGKSLFQIARLDPVWIRVPVYVGQREEIDTAVPADVREFGKLGKESSRQAAYAAAPPAADPLAATVDLVWELSNSEGKLHPGHKLSVTVTLKSTRPALVAPASAVLYDIHGGTWVYEEIAPRTFTRRRVEVSHLDGRDAILAAGPAPGAKLVAAGAAELFGTEFGIGK